MSRAGGRHAPSQRRRASPDHAAARRHRHGPIVTEHAAVTCQGKVDVGGEPAHASREPRWHRHSRAGRRGGSGRLRGRRGGCGDDVGAGGKGARRPGRDVVRQLPQRTAGTAPRAGAALRGGRQPERPAGWADARVAGRAAAGASGAGSVAGLRLGARRAGQPLPVLGPGRRGSRRRSAVRARCSPSGGPRCWSRGAWGAPDRSCDAAVGAPAREGEPAPSVVRAMRGPRLAARPREGGPPQPQRCRAPPRWRDVAACRPGPRVVARSHSGRRPRRRAELVDSLDPTDQDDDPDPAPGRGVGTASRRLAAWRRAASIDGIAGRGGRAAAGARDRAVAVPPGVDRTGRPRHGRQRSARARGGRSGQGHRHRTIPLGRSQQRSAQGWSAVADGAVTAEPAPAPAGDGADVCGVDGVDGAGAGARTDAAAQRGLVALHEHRADRGNFGVPTDGHRLGRHRPGHATRRPAGLGRNRSYDAGQPARRQPHPGRLGSRLAPSRSPRDRNRECRRSEGVLALRLGPPPRRPDLRVTNRSRRD